ncbi:MAG: recombination regulator RecX [Bacillaceae bacterium]|nr:recombination regulator RecX [Bacillaceae bacterium]
MSKITRITAQKKNKNRYNIYLDDGNGEYYGFSVSQDLLVQYMLRKGMELDAEAIKQLKRYDDLHKFYTLSLHFLSYRMRSEQEVREYLQKKEANKDQEEEIIRRLKQEGYIDDLTFADMFVRSRINTTSKGPLLIKKELIQKGVAAEVAEEALQLFDEEKQCEKARKWAEKKLNTSDKKSFRQKFQSLQQTLLQKGFSSSVIQQILEESASDTNQEDQEWEALVYQGEKILVKYQRKSCGYELKQKVKGALYRKGFAIETINRFIEEYDEEFYDKNGS